MTKGFKGERTLMRIHIGSDDRCKDRPLFEAIIELLFDLRRRQGTTLLLITHDPALAARCDRILKLADGRILEDRRIIENGRILEDGRAASPAAPLSAAARVR